MRKSLLKKIGVVASGLVLSMAMSTAVFAASTTDATNNWNGIETTDNTISIAKQIVFINGEDTTVREPNITYTYTLATTAPGSATVTDHEGITGTVKAGPMSAASSATASATFADTSTAAATANGTGQADIKHASFSFSPSAFGNPGIYRYKVTESTDVSKESVGIEEAGSYAKTRYLDVYVSKTSNTDPTLKIYGYVMFEGSETQTINSNDVSMKSAGFVNSEESGSGQTDVDIYRTQNLYIEKMTTGTMADPENDFPVSIALTAANGVTAAPKIDVTVEGSGALLGTSNDSVGTYIPFAANLAGTVRNGSSIYLKGIPQGTAAALIETNNTQDSYRVKAGTASEGDDLLAEAIVAAGADSAATAAQTLEAKTSVYFTNTLDQISPTNVVTRFAPYLFILGAAVLLLMVMRRRKANDEE